MILKPDPGNPQELYLESLQALGIDTRAHDVRFVEDNWENPALGAWGLGWEVWMDGEDSRLCPRNMKRMCLRLYSRRRPRDHAIHLLPAGRGPHAGCA